MLLLIAIFFCLFVAAFVIAASLARMAALADEEAEQAYLARSEESFLRIHLDRDSDRTPLVSSTNLR